jgi:hypothetical protein
VLIRTLRGLGHAQQTSELSQLGLRRLDAAPKFFQGRNNDRRVEHGMISSPQPQWRRIDHATWKIEIG